MKLYFSDPADKSSQLHHLQPRSLRHHQVYPVPGQALRVPVLLLQPDLRQPQLRGQDRDGVRVRQGGAQHVDDRGGAGHHPLHPADPGDRCVLWEEGEHASV